MEKHTSARPWETSLLYASAVLGLGAAVVKLLGALFKIPLTNLLGGVGMASFNVAYEIYLPLYALFVSGIPAAVSRQVSVSMASGRLQDARRLLPLSLWLFGLLGGIGSAGMFFGAEPFAAFVQNPHGVMAVRALSPALLFGSITACCRGYSQGRSDMLPTSLSQMIEALGKLILGLGLSAAALRWCENQYRSTGFVFNVFCANPEEAAMAMLPYAAAAAILGVTLSNLCGMLFLCLLQRFRPGIPPALMAYSQPPSSKSALMRRLLRTAIPICLTAVIANLTSFLDLASVMGRLNKIVSEHESLLRQMYQNAIPAELSSDQLAAYLYGSYSGMATPLFNLAPTLTGVLAASLLPLVSSAWTRGGKAEFSRLTRSAVLWSAVISFPAGMGLFCLAEPILRLLYPGRPMEVTVIAPSLSLMGLGAMLVGVTLPVNAALQAVGKASLPMKLMLGGGALKLVSNYFLVAVPTLNIHGAPIGTILCYLFVLSAGLFSLSDVCETLDLQNILGKPLIASLLCSIGAKGCFSFLSTFFSHGSATICAIFFAMVVYLFALLLLKAITKDDIFILFSGKKFEKLLAKVRILG